MTQNVQLQKKKYRTVVKSKIVHDDRKIGSDRDRCKYQENDTKDFESENYIEIGLFSVNQVTGGSQYSILHCVSN